MNVKAYHELNPDMLRQNRIITAYQVHMPNSEEGREFNESHYYQAFHEFYQAYVSVQINVMREKLEQLIQIAKYHPLPTFDEFYVYEIPLIICTCLSIQNHQFNIAMLDFIYYILHFPNSPFLIPLLEANLMQSLFCYIDKDNMDNVARTTDCFIELVFQSEEATIAFREVYIIQFFLLIIKNPNMEESIHDKAKQFLIRLFECDVPWKRSVRDEVIENLVDILTRESFGLHPFILHSLNALTNLATLQRIFIEHHLWEYCIQNVQPVFEESQKDIVEESISLIGRYYKFSPTEMPLDYDALVSCSKINVTAKEVVYVTMNTILIMIKQNIIDPLIQKGLIDVLKMTLDELDLNTKEIALNIMHLISRVSKYQAMCVESEFMSIFLDSLPISNISILTYCGHGIIDLLNANSKELQILCWSQFEENYGYFVIEQLSDNTNDQYSQKALKLLNIIHGLKSDIE